MMGTTKRNCDNCNKPYLADNRNLKRGWGLCCSKKCAAEKREKSKPGYNPLTVARNNEKRRNWKETYFKKEFDPHDYEHPFSSEALGQWDD